ncbi:MAG: DUF433 domain-containing protein [Planctomycetota bacterium]|nr:DUF433 domain-containing protein [Planctomycetota bacterium]
MAAGTGSRVSLDSLVRAYWEGRMPEAIAADFPSLSLEQIHGAIAFYLGHRDEIDAYLASQGTKWDALRTESETRLYDTEDLVQSGRGRRHARPPEAPQRGHVLHLGDIDQPAQNRHAAPAPREENAR